ncbi:glycogen operon protein glgX-2 [Marinitoga sp. 1197]|uniref:glycogen debranching protein GlgX n=1 Tax=Marinitoga sp. 1197 TaxID=1428449 RepID=UPI0006411359|nr:glycogen debranching protein GlgX [Marinitoga sp. 1197]KLO22398.1 glycogen operon protein glgX-2 [Marinitoga sp. 1197]
MKNSNFYYNNPDNSVLLKSSRGYPKLGAIVDSGGVNFGIFTKNSTKVILELYQNFYDDIPSHVFELDPIKNKTGDIWHIYIHNIKHGQFYGWRVDGVYDPINGLRFNKYKLLSDPYAKAISGSYNWDEDSVYGYDKKSSLLDLSFSTIDSAKSPTKSVVIDDSVYDWEDDVHPRIPLKDLIIYEMNVRLFTMNPNSNIKNRGTFDGIIEKLSYLKDLGVNAVELMPIFEFNPNSIIRNNPITGEKLKDVWGYNPLAFFAVTGNYSNGLKIGEQVFLFKDFVKALHKEGFEIILDVVYNHTGEGNELGPTLSFRGIDNSVYYILSKNKRYYENYSGCGNTFNCNNTVVKNLIIDSLRYWVTEMHVDGFRFDLASILGRDSNGNWIGDLSLLKDIAEDPIISGSKLIAEGWDAAGGYFLGAFPEGWAEWNGKFRDSVRKFVRGDMGLTGEIACRIAGSEDLYGNKSPMASVNFITSHDGFTMWDLVSYNNKHNEENGENNQDGTNDNYSFNYGIEGETNNLDILKVRKQQIKNFFTILMISQGTPMIYMGDEFCRTQYGNNNAYCQDTIKNWVDWKRKDDFSDIFQFVRKVINFRKIHHTLRREHFFTGKDYSGDGIPDITWHGIKLNQPDFSYYSKSLAFMISGIDFVNQNVPPDNDIYVALNFYEKDLSFELPFLNNKSWFRVIDTYFDSPDDFLDFPQKVSNNYIVKTKSIIVLISK